MRATLRVPSLGPFLGSTFVQFLCAQIITLALQWLVTGLTEQRLLITLVGFAQGATIALFSPLGGVIADRLPKRRLLLVGRLLLAALTCAIASGVAAERVAIPHVIVVAFLGGLVAAALQPATQTFVFDLVGRDRVESAVALNATGSGVAQVIGPALGAALLAWTGIAGAFFWAATGLVLSAALLLRVPVEGRRSTASSRSPLQELREGFAWVRGDPPVRLVLLGCTMALFNGAVYSMRPVFARFVLDAGEVGLGGLTAAAGLGTVLAALVLAGFHSFPRVGVWIIGSMFGYALCVLAYAFAPSYELLLLVELGIGITGQVWNVTVVAGLQLAVPEAMRGRVLGMVFMVAQLGFVGHPIVGWLADRFGDRPALAVFGLIPSVVLGCLLVFRMRELWAVGERPAHRA